jgi:predicted transcriptional regulator
MGLGRRLLSAFLAENGINPNGAAEELGVSRTAVDKWLTGAARPTAKRQDQIERWSAGAVPVQSWMTAAEVRRAERVARAVEQYRA